VKPVDSRQQPTSQPWPLPIREGRWVHGGDSWHRRGRPITVLGPPLRRLLKRQDLRVLHCYGPHPSEVDGRERAALLERVERYFAGEAPPHSAFALAEFRNAAGQAMLVIEEMC
jgi:hypothetical protein